MNNKNRMGSVFVALVCCMFCQAAPTHCVDESPVSIQELGNGSVLVDFGRVAFGNLQLTAAAASRVTVHFGEAMEAGHVDRTPPRTVRYQAVAAALSAGTPTRVEPRPNRRNTQVDHATNPPAILTPVEWGVVMPFRWVEIEGWNGELTVDQIVRKSIYSATWNDDAARFESSDAMLNQIWELCRYSIKATTFAGVYVDGDRERIPYEADAYLNQLSHYYTDNDLQMARDTLDHLLLHGTWPSEWAPHLVFMAYADWMQTGDAEWLAGRYEQLKSKTLANRRGADHLIESNAAQINRIDIVDWPKTERDHYVFTARNTVVNAFYLRATKQMATLARVLGKLDEAEQFEVDFEQSYTAFQQTFFDETTGLYRDGVGTDHQSLHANLFPLAFGLTPESARKPMAQWLAKRGMACSVYAAQYLLQGLFENGAGDQALALMTADNDRSWHHMVESGATITWEAWDHKYKPNQDWSHAWGAAPANIVPNYIVGAEPLTPGWETARICPNTAGLSFANGMVPTPRGPIQIEWSQGDSFKMKLALPEGMNAQVELPVGEAAGEELYCNGVLTSAKPVGGVWSLQVRAECSVLIELK